MGGAELVLALVGSSTAASALGAVVTGYVGYRLRAAQAQHITATAHSEIYKAYGDLLDELRAELHSLRTELEAAESRARQAEVRASAAEAELSSLRGEVALLRERIALHEAREAQLLAELARLRG